MAIDAARERRHALTFSSWFLGIMLAIPLVFDGWIFGLSTPGGLFMCIWGLGLGPAAFLRVRLARLPAWRFDDQDAKALEALTFAVIWPAYAIATIIIALISTGFWLKNRRHKPSA